MSIDFFTARCSGSSDKRIFGLCDKAHPAKEPAYIDEDNGKDWIAVIENNNRETVQFIAVDHCIDLLKVDGKMDSRCDGMLYYNTTVIFVELKERSGLGNEWVKDGEKQLRATIKHFEQEAEAVNYTFKKAYIANSGHPKFKTTQAGRMEQFLADTGYVLRIENRIAID
ncbi:MAG: hypothetical protein H7257_13720 [Taibaiella sp.]|nr:hypothetical protein [Taibaiella sp.]